MKKRVLMICMGLMLALSGCGNDGAKDADVKKEASKDVSDEKSSKEKSGKEKSEKEISDEDEDLGDIDEIETDEDAAPIDISKITGEHVLAESDNFVITMTDGIKYEEHYMEMKYRIPVKIEAKEGYVGNYMISIDYLVINNVQVKAQFDGVFASIDSDFYTEYEGYIDIETEDMLTYSMILEDTAIQKIYGQFNELDYEQGGSKLVSGEVKSDDCPAEFAIASSCDKIYSDDYQNLYYAGVLDVDEHGMARLLYIRESDRNDGFWRTTLCTMLLADETPLSQVKAMNYSQATIPAGCVKAMIMKVDTTEIDFDSVDELNLRLYEAESQTVTDYNIGKFIEMYGAMDYTQDIKADLESALK